MKAEKLQQGTPEWLAHRSKHFNASDAAAMLGLSKYKTRAELLREKATGIVPEVNEHTQRLFDRGHEIEALARTYAEEYLDIGIDESLEPMVCAGDVDGLPLSVSLDGLLGKTSWECKTLNADLLAALNNGVIPDEYHYQMEQGLMLSGAERCLFTASDGTREGTMHAWYESRPEVRKQLLAGWKQFAEDVANYQHVDSAVEVVGTPQIELPAVVIQVNGQITISDNLAKFGDVLTAYVSRINKSPETDQDFADLDDQAKNLRRAIEWLDAAENSAMAQAEPIDAMRRVVAQYREIARSNAILAEKLVKVEKDNRKAAIIIAGREELAEHVKKLNSRLGGEWMPVIVGDFVGVTKGLKTIQSYKDKVSTELARCKIEANEIADIIQGNRRTMEQLCDPVLFPDWKQVCTMAPDDFAALVSMLVSQHNERMDAERERIRHQEAEKLAKAEQDQRGKASTEDVKPVPDTRTADAPGAVSREDEETQVANASTPPDNGARMKLGDINARLGFTVTADFLGGLGYKPVAQEKNAKIYRECDFPGICAAIIRHVQARVDEGDGVYRSWD